MSRVAQILTTKTITLAVAGLVLISGAGISLWSNTVDDSPKKTESSVSTKTQTEKLTYQGEDGKSALQLLKKHAKVETKSSSLGEYVVSINGSDGDGKKYWLYYVNDQEANVGAGAYITRNSDKIEWKLQ